MEHTVSHDELMRYLDGELAPNERARVDAHVAACSECRRELTVFRELKADLQVLSLRTGDLRLSVWDTVHRRLRRPVGWTLVLAGAAAWLAYGAYTFAVAPVDLWEKLAAGAVGTGMLLLLASVIWERYREWQTDPYRDIQR